MKQKPPGAGKESLGTIDAPSLFTELDLSRTRIFLDLGCGPGKYSLEVLQHLSQEAMVIAVDLWEEGLRNLQESMKARDISRISPILADIGRGIPLKMDTVDVCLVANALHELILSKKNKEALREITRVLEPKGEPAVTEFKKVPGTGSPLHILIEANQLSDMVKSHGFRNVKVVETGPYNYLPIYRLEVNDAYGDH